MNLSPEWVIVLSGAGHDVMHWREIGSESAPDSEIIDWAAQEQRAIFTADHGFAAAVAMRGLVAPSVVQLRTGYSDPNNGGTFVSHCLAAAESELFGGAILTIDPGHARLRRGPHEAHPSDES